jgi:hypothetical protein
MKYINPNFIINVIFPILLGLIIYLLYRDTSLLVFDWISYIYLDDFIFKIREYLESYKLITNGFLIYTLPDGLWSYSLTYVMCLIWFDIKNKIKYFMISIGIIFGVFLELGQLFNLIQGTFDINDLIVSILFPVIAYIIYFIFYRKEDAY